MTRVIEAEKVGKKYIIDHQKQEKYFTLRDSISSKFKNIFNGGLNSSREDFWALKDISFDIDQGDRVGLIGRNGAGKSTMLKVLSKITEPTEGIIKIKGRVASLLEVGTGFHPELTGRENIFLNGAILGMSKAEIKRKFDEIVAFAEVERFLYTPVKRYSSGMYVRLAFAVAAHLEPEILVVDEVLAVGDAQFQKKCLGKMQEVGKKGRTVIFVSHNMNAIKALCNKGVLLNKGKIIKTGSTGEVCELYDRMGINADERNTPLIERKRSSECSLDAKIVDIDLITENGNRQINIDSKKPLKINLTVEVYNPVSFQISIKICENNDLILSDLSTCFYKGPYTFESGTYNISCEVAPSFLTEGEYKINCHLAGYKIVDFVPDAYYFKVESFDVCNSGFSINQNQAKFYIEHKWNEAVKIN